MVVTKGSFFGIFQLNVTEVLRLRKAIMSAEPTKKGNNRNAQAIGSRQILVGHTGFQHHVKHYGHKKASSEASTNSKFCTECQMIHRLLYYI